MQKTKIEWCDYTWNPVTGCKNTRCSSYCYARKIATRFEGSVSFPVGFEPTFWGMRLDDPKRIRKPSRIFVCSMGELFGPWVMSYDINQVLATVRACPQHTFIFLTKYPGRLREFNPWPENCWVGVSATDDDMAMDAYVHLCRVDAITRFVSFEPLLSEIDDFTIALLAQACRWFIVGAQTGPLRSPCLYWVEQIYGRAKHDRVPIFLKDNLKLALEEVCAEVPAWISTREFPRTEASA